MLLTVIPRPPSSPLFPYTTLFRSERWGVRLTAGFHGIPMGAPHTRPLGVTAHATCKDLVGDHQPLPNRLQVPGSLAALLERSEERRVGKEWRARRAPYQ